jgi:type I site-specific restriction-modification system R (restriction) subunit
MNEIKVTVAYEKPTTSKFDALMREYEVAKKYADETVSYYKPLADVAEDAKMSAILEQLETIKEYARKLRTLSDKHTARISACVTAKMRSSYHSSGAYFEIYCDELSVCSITWSAIPFTLENLATRRYDFTGTGWNILGMWDEWHIYEKLEEEALRQIRSKITEQTRRSNAEKNRLHNITKGGN